MAKKNTLEADLLKGLGVLGDSVNNASSVVSMGAKKSRRYSARPQVKGRIARAFAHETHGGKGKDALRAGYKHHMKKGYKQTSPQERAKIVRALAKNTVRGKGLIRKRPAYKRFVK